jgi:outer membrane protein TolC
LKKWIVLRLTACFLPACFHGCIVTPHPLTQNEIEIRATNDLRLISNDQEPITGPIDIYEASARALKYNLETKVKTLRTMLAHQQVDFANYSLLPQVAINAGYDGRSNFTGGTASSLLTGRQLLEPFTSSDRDLFLGNLALSWDVLDFGLSYIRAKQAADNVLIAEEEKRRIAIRVLQEVRGAFWRAASARKLLHELSSLNDWVNKALSDTKEVFTQRLQPPLTPLAYRRELLNVQREVQRLYRELGTAKYQLAALMNIPPGTDFELEMPSRESNAPTVKIDMEALELQALLSRPELRTIDYQKRINANDSTAAMLELLPNLRLSLGGFYNSNSFLFHHNWLGYAAQTSWNLMNVFLKPLKQSVIKAQGEVLDAQSLALTMTVLTEVHVSRAQLHYAHQELSNSKQYYDNQVLITDHVGNMWTANSTHELAVINERVNKVLAEIRLDVAHAGVESSLASIRAAIGEDVLPNVTLALSVGQISDLLRERWELPVLAVAPNQENRTPHDISAQLSR